MWWKLTGLALITAALIFSVIPFRTHWIVYEVPREGPLPRPPDWSFSRMVANMYLTPQTVALIVAILVAATFIAFRIVRANNQQKG